MRAQTEGKYGVSRTYIEQDKEEDDDAVYKENFILFCRSFSFFLRVIRDEISNLCT